MRAISNEASAVLASAAVPVVLLVEILLTEPFRVASGLRAITLDGATYTAVGDLGNVEQVEDSPGEYKPLQFELSGVRNDLLAIAMNEPTRGKPISLRMAVLDPSTHAVLDAPLVWSGSIDQMTIQVGPETGRISVTAEHRGATFARPKPLRYTDVDQQRLFPGDTSMRFVASQANHPDVWPAAAWGRQT